MVKLILAEALHRFADGNDALMLDINNLNELPEQLKASHASLYNALFSEGSLHPYVRFYLNDQMLPQDCSESFAFKENDVIESIVAVSGG